MPAGGQGGGSFYIPLFSVLLGFTVNEAAALSSSVVFFGCIPMVLQAAVSRHPRLPEMPQIDYWSVLMLTPVLIVGLTLGQPFNAMVSAWLLNILVISIWIWSTIQCYLIYRRTRAKETEAAAITAAAQASLPSKSYSSPLEGHSNDQQPIIAGGPSVGRTGVDIRPQWHSRMLSATRDWWAMQPHAVIWCILLLFGFFLTAQVRCMLSLDKDCVVINL